MSCIYATCVFLYVDTPSNNEKLNKAKLEKSLAKKFKVSTELIELIISLLQKFELIIPLSPDTLLMPSFLQSKQTRILFAMEERNFPRKKATCFHFDNRDISPQGREFFSSCTEQEHVHHILLHFTGMCYQRIFLFDNMPMNFWPKLISHCLLSTEPNSFHKIICNNCCPQIFYKPTPSTDTALIGDLLCKWSYWKNCIELSLGENILLCINALDISTTLSKLEKMHIYKANADLELQTQKQGFEVSIPDYEIISRASSSDSAHYSDVMSMQILSHVLETIDETLKTWVEGSSSKGIYTNKELCQIIPCPYCYIDKNTQIDTSSSIAAPSDTSNSNCIAFSIQYVLQRTLYSNEVKCPQHSALQIIIEHLAPDLVRFCHELFVIYVHYKSCFLM